MAEVNGNDQHLSGLRVMLSAAVGSIFLFFLFGFQIVTGVVSFF